jgi:hypothetical protein
MSTRRAVLRATAIVVLGGVLVWSFWWWLNGERSLGWGEPTTSFAAYRLPDGSRLRIECPARMVAFRYEDASGRTLTRSDIDASVHMPWAMCVTADGSVWLASHDIGTYVWRRRAAGGYERDAEMPGHTIHEPLALENALK